jgi:aspartate/methionine/tyrosine aminotransferase
MLYSSTVVHEIARLAIRHDAYIVVDQLYFRLRYDDLPFTHIAALPGMAERTVTLMGPSKTESMSGYRVGVAVGPPGIVDAMEDVLSVAALRAPAYAQHTLRGWLIDDHAFVADRIAEYGALRDACVAAFDRSDVATLRPAMGTAYMFADVAALGRSDQEVAVALKRDAGVLINPGYQFGSAGLGHFRICFAQDEQELSSALGRMMSVLRDLRTT